MSQTARRLRSAAGVLTSAFVVFGAVAACGGGDPGSDPLALIGKSFEDPAVSDLARGVCGGIPHDNAENVKCIDQGFELNLLSDLSVGSVSLFNDEGGGFSQYRGAMPYDLSWSDTYPTVYDKLGPPDALNGGNGVDVYALYQHLGTYSIEVHFYALHNNPEDLANSRIRMIHVAL